MSSGFYKLNGKANVYGGEYASVMAPLGRVRIVAPREGKAKKAPAESMASGRVYATVDKETGNSILFRTSALIARLTSR